MTLKDVLLGQEYTIQQVNTDDEELNSFLFSLNNILFPLSFLL